MAKRGRGGQDKAVVAVAVEHRVEGLNGFLRDTVRPGSHVLTDGWSGYWKVEQQGFEHAAIAVSAQPEPAPRLFPWVHITLANLKRFLLGTHHAVEGKHLEGYVAEFNYRLNRRTMEQDLLQRLLRATLSTPTITYKQLIATPELSG